MLKHIGKWAMLSSLSMLPILSKVGNSSNTNQISTIKAFKLSNQRALPRTCCGARRRVRYEDEDDERGEEEHGYNEEIAMLELYSQSARGEALLVHALVDEQEVEVLIFKGFSSCLNYGTSPDPSRSVIPARAVIKSIDRIKGPFDPSNVEYIEKGLKWESFKTRLGA
ncbi:uncharacterized protein LOC111317528 [Durio zibethinus]|uniref:Uncharacterized protein LOC111317528 n=1 Tax=Durio zibethinus TaxID=66656 RepID=A0A6P6BEZ3_DURZI|nr:uncharacterized protein LOC111317528 [Durio zibethinus]